MPQNEVSKIHSGLLLVSVFNKVTILITGIIQMDLRSGDWTSKNNRIQVVKTRRVNLVGRNILFKLRFFCPNAQVGL